MKFLLLFFIALVFSTDVFSLPLVVKTTKDIKLSGELLTFDTTKYKQIRIAVKQVKINSNDLQSEILQRRIRLITEIEDLRKVFKNTHPTLESKQNELNKINDEIDRGNDCNIQIEAVEDGETIFLQSLFLSNSQAGQSIELNSPPSKVMVSASKAGTYKIYIWAN